MVGAIFLGGGRVVLDWLEVGWMVVVVVAVMMFVLVRDGIGEGGG